MIAYFKFNEPSDIVEGARDFYSFTIYENEVQRSIRWKAHKHTRNPESSNSTVVITKLDELPYVMLERILWCFPELNIKERNDMPVLYACDECGKVSAIHYGPMTGRVLIEGVDNNTQSCLLCEEHYPREGKHQPHNCKRVRFYWSSMTEWNEEISHE